MNEFESLGRIAKVLLDLHLEDPKTYNDSYVLEKLFNNYEKLGFAPNEEVKEDV